MSMTRECKQDMKKYCGIDYEGINNIRDEQDEKVAKGILKLRGRVTHEIERGDFIIIATDFGYELHRKEK